MANTEPASPTQYRGFIKLSHKATHRMLLAFQCPSTASDSNIFFLSPTDFGSVIPLLVAKLNYDIEPVQEEIATDSFFIQAWPRLPDELLNPLIPVLQGETTPPLSLKI